MVRYNFYCCKMFRDIGTCFFHWSHTPHKSRPEGKSKISHAEQRKN